MKISVIIPVYNTAAYLQSCVKSVLAQTYHDFELILVDDGSTDGSSALCDELAAADSRIKVLHRQNGGVSNARNAGIEAAAGEYISFIDSDDTVKPDYLSTVFNISNNTGADIVFCGVEYICDGRIDMTTAGAAQPGVLEPKQILELQPADNLMLWGPCSKLIKTALIKNNNIVFDETLYNGEDIVFVAECVFRAKKTYYDPTPYYQYVKHGVSASAAAFNEKQATFFTAAEKVMALVSPVSAAAADAWKKVLFDYAAGRLTEMIRTDNDSGELIGLLKTQMRRYYGFYMRSSASLRQKIRAALLTAAPKAFTRLYWGVKGIAR